MKKMLQVEIDTTITEKVEKKRCIADEIEKAIKVWQNKWFSRLPEGILNLD